MYITSCIYSVGQSTQFSYAVVDALSTADMSGIERPGVFEKTGEEYRLPEDVLAYTNVQPMSRYETMRAFSAYS
jgi:hypothetical protein